MSKVLDLMDERAKAWNAAKKFLDSKSKDGKFVSAEDAEQYDRMEKDVTDLGKQIDILERADAIDRELATPTSTPLTNAPQGHTDKQGSASDSYKKAFWNQLKSKTPIVTDALSEGVDTDGGYLVPDEFDSKLVQKLYDDSVMRKLATVIRTSGDHKIAVAGDAATASWVGEGAAIPESSTTFGQKALGAHKLATMLKVSEELLNDSAFDLESYISDAFGRAVSELEDSAFVSGAANSTDKPIGLLPSIATDGITTSEKTGVVSFDDLISVYFSLKAPYRQNATWIMNDTTVSAIRKLKDSNGNYIWQPSTVAGTPDMILARPYVTSDYAPAFSGTDTGAAIGFGDMSYYWIGDREGISFKRLNELYAVNGQVGFMVTKRVDGKLTLDEAVKGLAIKRA